LTATISLTGKPEQQQEISYINFKQKTLLKMGLMLKNEHFTSVFISLQPRKLEPAYRIREVKTSVKFIIYW